MSPKKSLRPPSPCHRLSTRCASLPAVLGSFAAAPAQSPGWTDVGFGTRNPLGIPEMTATAPRVGRNLGFGVQYAVPGSPAAIILGLEALYLSVGGGGGALVPSLGLWLPLSIDGNGRCGFTLPFPLPELVGQPLFVQAGVFGSQGFAFSNGLEGRITDRVPLRVDAFAPPAAPIRLSEGNDVTRSDADVWKAAWWRASLFDVEALRRRFQINSGVNGVSYWNPDYKDILALGLMYEATEDPDYLARWKQINDVLLEYRSDRQSPPRVDTRRNRVCPAWTYWWQGHDHAEIAINGVYGHSLAWFARIVAEDPRLHARYGADAVRYTNAVLETIEFFDREDLRFSNPSEPSHPSAYYHSVSLGLPAANNIVHLLGRTMIELHRTLRSHYYATHPNRDVVRSFAQISEIPDVLAKLARRFMHRDPLNLRLVGGTHYVWPYREYHPPDTLEVEDASHGAITAMFLAMLYDQRDELNRFLTSPQVPLSQLDMQRFAATFVEAMTDDRALQIHHYVDGRDITGRAWDWANGEAQGWLALAGFDARIYARADAITLRASSNRYLERHAHAAFLRRKPTRYCNVRISYGGRTQWLPLRQTDATRGEIVAGDFTGDGRDDLFRPQQGRWSISDDGKHGWQPINTSVVLLQDLRFGDFDGNGYTDVFRVQGGSGQVSWGSRARHSNWYATGSFPDGVTNLVLGDFNGDGTTDFIRLLTGRWEVAIGTHRHPGLDAPEHLGAERRSARESDGRGPRRRRHRRHRQGGSANLIAPSQTSAAPRERLVAKEKLGVSCWQSRPMPQRGRAATNETPRRPLGGSAAQS